MGHQTVSRRHHLAASFSRVQSVHAEHLMRKSLQLWTAWSAKEATLRRVANDVRAFRSTNFRMDLLTAWRYAMKRHREMRHKAVNFAKKQDRLIYLQCLRAWCNCAHNIADARTRGALVADQMRRQLRQDLVFSVH